MKNYPDNMVEVIYHNFLVAENGQLQYILWHNQISNLSLEKYHLSKRCYGR